MLDFTDQCPPPHSAIPIFVETSRSRLVSAFSINPTIKSQLTSTQYVLIFPHIHLPIIPPSPHPHTLHAYPPNPLQTSTAAASSSAASTPNTPSPPSSPNPLSPLPPSSASPCNTASAPSDSYTPRPALSTPTSRSTIRGTHSAGSSASSRALGGMGTRRRFSGNRGARCRFAVR